MENYATLVALGCENHWMSAPIPAGPGKQSTQGTQATQGTLLCLLTVMLWGAQFPIGKMAMTAMDGFHASAIRYVIATVVLALLLLWREGAKSFRYFGRFRRVATAGVVGFTFSGLFVFCGLQITRPEHAAIIASLQPTIAVLAAWIIWKRRPSVFSIVCIVVAFVGVVAVVTQGEWQLAVSSRELFGDFLVLIGGTMWVAYTMLSERIRGWSAIRYTTLAMIPGTVVIVAITGLLVAVGAIHPPSVAQVSSVWPQLLYLGIFGLVISMIAWIAGLKRVGAVNATLFTSLIPVVAFAVRAAQGATFSAIEIGGAVVVIAALVANNLHLRTHT